ncbi:MAG: efflux RND transporter periplasmic adaptor subunit [Zetaproteobacteria bacterium]|nr:MAG: efflux RND transporter periplasmic adaptor subunit [Zetaproteobacteria bacterium]
MNRLFPAIVVVLLGVRAAWAVDLVAVRQVETPIHYVTSGSVISEHRVAVGSRLSGYIHDLTVHEGDRIRQGALLFRIDPVDVRQQLAQAEANLANARADLKRFRTLLKSGAISRQQFDQVKLRFDVASSRVKQARNQLNYAVVRSPLDGVVVKKLKHNGDLASPGAPVLMIENTGNMTVDTRVSEQFVPRIHVGDRARVEVRGFPHPFTAVVRRVVSAAEARSHQFLVKLTLPANSGVLPGSLAEVAFTTGSRRVLALPATALLRRHGLTGVYLVDGHKRLHWRLVRPGRMLDGGMVEIAAGLHRGDRVVRTPSDAMHSGAAL